MSTDYGGFADAAARLAQEYGTTRQGSKFTRQQVFTWWMRRGNNHFPDRYETDKGLRFRLPEIVRWYAAYVPDKGGRRSQGKGKTG